MSADGNEPASRRTLPWAIAIAVAFFACIAPTLRWMEFSSGIEALNVATVLEIHRDGPWLLPTLEGKPRIEKPPLTAWITSLATRRSTTSALDDPDPARRDSAYVRLAFDVRWTAVLTGAFTLLAVYALGTIVADGRTALVAAVICATNYFFLRFTRFATTDVQLMLWVTLANVFLARCVLYRVTWPSALGAGAALGLAFMAKGPVAFVQTLIPAGVYLLLIRPRRGRIAWLPIIVAAIVMLAIGLWWFVVVAMREPGVISRWLSETNPAGGDRMSSSKVYTYGVIFVFVVPWTVFLVHGCALSIASIGRHWRDEDRATSLRSTYPTVLLLSTIVLMSCFQDRKDRYLLPMIPIAALIAAQSAVLMLKRAKNSLPDWSHWTMLVGLALAPLLGLTTVVKTVDNGAWFTTRLAVSATVIALVIVLAGIVQSRRSRIAIIVTPFILMMFLQVVGVIGYRQSREGRSELRPLAEFIRQRYPTAQLYNFRGQREEKRAPVDLAIYLNRPTLTISDPAKLELGDRPQIYVQVQGRKDPEPHPAPGWQFFHKVRRDKDWYIAFLRIP